MEITKLTNAECCEMVWESVYDPDENYDNPRYKVVQDTLEDQNRWSAMHSLVVVDTVENKYYETYYQKGLTEYQDESPFEQTDPKWEEVVPVETTVITYQKKDN